MFIGEDTLTTLIENENLNWMNIEFDSKNRSIITISDNKIFCINRTVDEIYDIFEKSENYVIPTNNNFIDSFLAINQHNIETIHDEYILFINGQKLENIYENSEVLIDIYQLPLNFLYT